jgi:hypothetical protein
MTIQRFLMLISALLVFIIPWVINTNRQRAAQVQRQQNAADAYRAGMEFAGLVEGRNDAK